MQIPNFFKMNDWPIKSFLVTIFSIQLVVFGLIFLDLLGLHVPILREVFCFLYLTFVPGFIILKILKVHKLGSAENLLYAIGLSISSLMLIGVITNFFYPIIGVDKPFKLEFLILTSGLIVLFMCLVSYFRDKDFHEPWTLDLKDISSPWVLFLILIPFMGIFGAYFMNNGSNLLQMVLLLFSAFLPLLALKLIPKKYYPLLIFVLSLALLYHTSLISNYLWGADINVEKYFSSLVVQNYFWDLNLKDNVNAMLSVTILGPFYSIFLGNSITWVYKVIYPLLFSFVPLALFTIYKKISNEKISFLAVYFFVSINAFFTTLVAAPRQEIAELFLVILILITLNKSLKGISKSLILIIFALSIVVSHYGVSYLMIFLIFIASFVSLTPLRRLFKDFEENSKFDYVIINKTIALLFITFALAWFMYVSTSSIFNIGVNIINNAYLATLDLVNTTSTQPTNIITGTMPLFQSIERYLYLICQAFIVVGIFSIFTRYNILKNNQEYKLFSIASIVILLFAIFIPFFASSMNTDRVFHISLIFLSPFFVIGSLMLFSILNKLFGKSKRINCKNAFYLIAVFLMIFSIFNSAFIYELFDQPKQGRFALNNNVDYPILNQQEVVSAQWLANNKNNTIKIYADVNKVVLVNFITFKPLNAKTIGTWDLNGTSLNKSYIFFSTYNIKSNQLYVQSRNGYFYYNFSDLPLINDRIYDNGGSFICA
ncbi:DUF2206 domain-containing protein [Methanobacterium sp.]|uniref:DUF2206 domain-containing protein n=1 Tax=Methanobacterium sp. TaxID=2164 RepID=UPI002AB8264C|nr:DUF2206 domain-containing protein [Methanobacterium sp.]MDY9922945.1 DUF2206 domain-containing protein [Methanobacterium sp.]